MTRPIVDISEAAMRETARKVCAVRPGVEPQTALAVIQALLVMGWRPEPSDGCQSLALCATCGGPLACRDCGDKHSTCGAARCRDCGDPNCAWPGADAVLQQLGWRDTPKPKPRAIPGAEPLSKPWRT